jgi:hypothetical protein
MEESKKASMEKQNVTSLRRDDKIFTALAKLLLFELN